MPRSNGKLPKDFTPAQLFMAFLRREEEYKAQPYVILQMWVATVETLRGKFNATAAWSNSEIEAVVPKLVSTQRYYYKDAWNAYRRFVTENAIPRLPPDAPIEVPEHFKSFVTAVHQLAKNAKVTLDEARAFDASQLVQVDCEAVGVFRALFDFPTRVAHISLRLEPELYKCCADAVSWSASLASEGGIAKVFPDTVWPYCREIIFRAPADVINIKGGRLKFEQTYSVMPLNEASLNLRKQLLLMKSDTVYIERENTNGSVRQEAEAESSVAKQPAGSGSDHNS